jgi:hypothetical protein
MSAVPNIAPSAKVLPLQVLVKGKVEASRRFDGKRYTRIITPAADAYSRPQVVEVRSVAKLGDLGDETEVTCRLGGYTRKPYRTTDKDTGETTMVTPVDLTLDAVE